MTADEQFEPLERLPPPPPSTWRTVYIEGLSALYLEDVEHIYDVLLRLGEEMPESSESEPRQIEMQTDEFRIEYPEQFLLLKRNSVPELSIRRSHPNLNVNCSWRRCSITINTKDPAVHSAFDQIVAIIKRRQQKPLLLLYSPWGIIGLGLILFGLTVFTTTIDPGVPLATAIPVAVLVTCVGMLWTILVRPALSGVLVPRYKIDAPSLLERNRDAIIVAAVSSAVTLLLGWVFGQLFGLF